MQLALFRGRIVLLRERVAYPVASARTTVSSGSRDSERTFSVATTRGENLRIQCGTELLWAGPVRRIFGYAIVAVVMH